MIYISLEDFFEKVSYISRITRAEEIECAKRMKEGDSSAREELVESYLPLVAAHIRKMPKNMHNLGFVLYCHQALEKAVDRFDFFQEGETFAHRLSWYLRQAGANYITRK